MLGKWAPEVLVWGYACSESQVSGQPCSPHQGLGVNRTTWERSSRKPIICKVRGIECYAAVNGSEVALNTEGFPRGKEFFLCTEWYVYKAATYVRKQRLCGLPMYVETVPTGILKTLIYSNCL